MNESLTRYSDYHHQTLDTYSWQLPKYLGVRLRSLEQSSLELG